MTRARTKDRRTGRSAIVPIHTLPFETMTRIFLLVLDTQRCCYDDNPPSQNISTKSPKILSHVCSRWRQIALGSRSIWSHIDLALFRSHSKFKQFLVRSEVFAARSDGLALNIHILGGRRHGPPRYYGDSGLLVGLNAFCASVATRIGALELLVDTWSDHGYCSILEKCFVHCVPGTLTKLVTMSPLAERYHSSGLFEVGDYTATFDNPLVGESNQCLKDLLLPVKVLRLADLCLPWDSESQAYHGLVDLQLASDPELCPPEISRLELARILAASPGLRLLRLGLTITDSDPGPPIVLNDLEVLSVGPMSHAQQNVVFQLISSGLRLQKVTIRFCKEALPRSPSDGLVRFMTHSNVAQLSIKYNGSIVFRWLPQLLRAIPSLKALSLTGLNLSLIVTIPTL